METRDLLTIIGWPVSCLLSIFAGGWLIPRLTKKKKILLWAVVTEGELISKDIHQDLSLPVSIQVGGATRESLSLVTIRLGTLNHRVGPAQHILYVRRHRRSSAKSLRR